MASPDPHNYSSSPHNYSSSPNPAFFTSNNPILYNSSKHKSLLPAVQSTSGLLQDYNQFYKKPLSPSPSTVSEADISYSGLDSNRMTGSFNGGGQWQQQQLNAGELNSTINYFQKVEGSDSQVIKEGFMNKRGHFVKNWKKRYFILKNGLLSYFTDKNGALKGVIRIQEGCFVEETKELPEMQHIWVLCSNLKKFVFQCDNSELCKEWMNVIGLAISRGERMPSVAELQNPDKSGWLVKKGHKVKNWKKRWFILFGNLYYYKTLSDMEPAGIIPLKQARVEVPKDRQLFIQIYTINNTEYVMQAETEKDAELWCKKITNAIIKENQKMGSTYS